MVFRGELRKYVENLNFENFESALNLTSVSMPLIVFVLFKTVALVYIVGFNSYLFNSYLYQLKMASDEL